MTTVFLPSSGAARRPSAAAAGTTIAAADTADAASANADTADDAAAYLASIRDPAGVFYRYSLATSVLRGQNKKDLP